MGDKLSTGEITEQTKAALSELFGLAGLRPGQILVLGCSTSEILGQRIGSMGSLEVAGAVLDGIMPDARAAGIFLSVQCCEHLNRALVIEEEAVERYGLEPVAVTPVPKAGGSTATVAMERFRSPAVVESVRGHAGLDIGLTMIGMHLRSVAVPIRIAREYVGVARVVAAKTRPKLIGGGRAVYPPSGPVHGRCD